MFPVRGVPLTLEVEMTVDQRIWAIVAKMTDRGVDALLAARVEPDTRGRLVTLAAARQAHWARG